MANLEMFEGPQITKKIERELSCLEPAVVPHAGRPPADAPVVGAEKSDEKDIFGEDTHCQ